MSLAFLDVLTFVGEFEASLGVTGGYMQGHVQVLLNMLEFRMTPQEALDNLGFRFNQIFVGTNSEIAQRKSFCLKSK